MGEGDRRVGPAERLTSAEALTDDEVGELAQILHDKTAAAVLLERAGLSLAHQPMDAPTPWHFWWRVSILLRDGAVPAGRRRILEEALREFPGNPVLRRGLDRDPESPAADAGGAPRKRIPVTRRRSPEWRGEGPYQSVLGKPGRVTGRISEGLVGEVRVTVRGSSEAFLAYASDPRDDIPEGSLVTVVEYLPPRSVFVRHIAALDDVGESR